VSHGGRDYCLNILLQLIRGPVPAIIENPEIIDIIDAQALEMRISTEQAWWDLVIEKFPEETSKSMAYMKACEENSEIAE
jgi:hypothetical protein